MRSVASASSFHRLAPQVSATRIRQARAFADVAGVGYEVDERFYKRTAARGLQARLVERDRAGAVVTQLPQQPKVVARRQRHPPTQHRSPITLW